MKLEVLTPVLHSKGHPHGGDRINALIDEAESFDSTSNKVKSQEQ